MSTWRTLYPIRPPVEEIPDPPPHSELRAHQLTVLMDDGDGRGLRIARRAYLDGKELLLPDGASVSVEVSNQNLMVATVRIIAEVQFVEKIDGPGFRVNGGANTIEGHRAEADG